MAECRWQVLSVNMSWDESRSSAANHSIILGPTPTPHTTLHWAGPKHCQLHVGRQKLTSGVVVGGGWVVSAGALILLYYPLPTPEACTIIGCHPPTGSFLCVVLGNNLKKGGNELIPTHNVEKISNPTHNKRAAISPAAKSPTQVTTELGLAGLS